MHEKKPQAPKIAGWDFIGEGEYNLAYKNKAETKVLKIPKHRNEKGATDTPERSVQLWNQINGHFGKAEVVDTPHGRGWTCPYIAGDNALDKDIINPLIDIFNNTGRIVVDSGVEGNFKKTPGGQVVCVDIGLALELAPEKSRRHSVVSTTFWDSFTFKKKADHFDDYARSFPETVKVTKALLFIKMNRPDIYDATFLKNNKNLVNKLADAYNKLPTGKVDKDDSAELNNAVIIQKIKNEIIQTQWKTKWNPRTIDIDNKKIKVPKGVKKMWKTLLKYERGELTSNETIDKFQKIAKDRLRSGRIELLGLREEDITKAFYQKFKTGEYSNVDNTYDPTQSTKETKEEKALYRPDKTKRTTQALTAGNAGDSTVVLHAPTHDTPPDPAATIQNSTKEDNEVVRITQGLTAADKIKAEIDEAIATFDTVMKDPLKDPTNEKLFSALTVLNKHIEHYNKYKDHEIKDKLDLAIRIIHSGRISIFQKANQSKEPVNNQYETIYKMIDSIAPRHKDIQWSTELDKIKDEICSTKWTGSKSIQIDDEYGTTILVPTGVQEIWDIIQYGSHDSSALYSALDFAVHELKKAQKPAGTKKELKLEPESEFELAPEKIEELDETTKTFYEKLKKIFNALPLSTEEPTHASPTKNSFKERYHYKEEDEEENTHYSSPTSR